MLAEELGRWGDAGLRAGLWWRDDDAVRDGPRLARLLELAGGRAPLALAVVPAGAGEDLARAVSGRRSAWVLQHGIAHRDHALAGQRRIELGGRLRPARARTALAAARARLVRLFGERFLPVLVPPWNRIDDALLPALAGAGLHGLSTLGRRAGAAGVSRLRVVNVHVDPVDWRNGRRFAGEERVLQALHTELSARRRGEADVTEPVGVMTHHAVHDEACWRFLEQLLAVTAAHPACRWREAKELFAPVNAPDAAGSTCVRSA